VSLLDRLRGVELDTGALNHSVDFAAQSLHGAIGSEQFNFTGGHFLELRSAFDTQLRELVVLRGDELGERGALVSHSNQRGIQARHFHIDRSQLPIGGSAGGGALLRLGTGEILQRTDTFVRQRLQFPYTSLQTSDP
jgi:hypothetical protein